jgi:hypothetical protein
VWCARCAGSPVTCGARSGCRPSALSRPTRPSARSALIPHAASAQLTRGQYPPSCLFPFHQKLFVYLSKDTSQRVANLLRKNCVSKLKNITKSLVVAHSIKLALSFLIPFMKKIFHSKQYTCCGSRAVYGFLGSIMGISRLKTKNNVNYQSYFSPVFIR